MVEIRFGHQKWIIHWTTDLLSVGLLANRSIKNVFGRSVYNFKINKEVNIVSFFSFK
jgi:hypothetical protein